MEEKVIFTTNQQQQHYQKTIDDKIHAIDKRKKPYRTRRINISDNNCSSIMTSCEMSKNKEEKRK